MCVTTQDIQQMFHDYRYEFDLYEGPRKDEGIEFIRTLQGPNGKKIELTLTLGSLPARQKEDSDKMFHFVWNIDDFLFYAIKHAEAW